MRNLPFAYKSKSVVTERLNKPKRYEKGSRLSHQTVDETSRLNGKILAHPAFLGFSKPP